MDRDKESKNISAILVGFALIALVVLIPFLRSYFSDKNSESADENTPAAESEMNKNKYASISSKDLLNRINARHQLIIIDVRSEEDYKKNHIVDSLNIPFSFFSEYFPEMSVDQEYILVDDLGLTPSEIRIMDFLLDNNFLNIIYLEGGFSSWLNNLNPAVTTGDPNSFTDQSKVSYIKSDDLNRQIADNEKLYIIDLRNKSDYDSGHIKNAENIPLDDLEKMRRQILPGRKIVLVDSDGLWAFQGAVKLFDMGIFNAYTLSDGMNTWKQKGFEMEITR